MGVKTVASNEEGKNNTYILRTSYDTYVSGRLYDLQIRDTDDPGYMGKIKEALGDHLGAREDILQYERMKAKVDIKRVHALKHQAEQEDTAFAYYYLAYAYEQIKDYDNAIWAINKAIERTDLNNQYKRYRTELVKHQESL